MIHRRRFLTGAAAALLPLWSSKGMPGTEARAQGLAAPQFLRPIQNDADHYPLSRIWDHARTPVENTARLQEAIDWLSINRKQLWVDRGDGRPYLIAPSTPSWREFGPTSLPAQRAITIRHDHFHLVGQGGRIVMVAPPGGQQANGKCYAFSTEQHMAIGAVSNVTVEGNPYDWDSAISYVPGGLTSNYMLGLCGVRGINLRSLLAANSSGSRRGAFAAIYNCADLRVTDFEMQFLQQGFNLNYVEDIAFRGIRARAFSEVVDANFPIHRAVFENLDGDNGGMRRGESQFLDLVGKDIRVSGLRVRNQTGNAIAVYAKGKSWPSYARHLEMAGAINPDPIAVENVVIENVDVEDAGLAAGYPIVMFGGRRRANLEGVGGVVDGVTYQPVPVPRNLTLRHLRARRTSGIAVHEGRDIRVEDVVLEDCYGGVHSDYFAFRCGQRTNGRNVREVSEFSGVVRDIRVQGARYGGILIDAPGEVTAANLHSEGWGAAGTPAPNGAPCEGFLVANLGLKPGTFRFSRFTALNTLNIDGRPSLHFAGFGAGPAIAAKPMQNEGGHRLTGPLPFGTSGAVAALREIAPPETVRLDRLDLAGHARGQAVSSLDRPLRRQRAGASSRFVAAELAGDLTGPMSLVLRKLRPDGSSVDVSVPVALRGGMASRRLSLLARAASADDVSADAIFSEGDQLVLAITGGGRVGSLQVELSQPEWLSS